MRLFSDVSATIADPLLREAFRLAEGGRGSTSPNPVVGCVIARDGEIVGRGYHEHAGGPHAEVMALQDAGERAAGADVAVTLEPCNHTGKTPPCTEALIAAGVASVRIGMPDPNPSVTGGGRVRLSAAGIRVSFADDPRPFEDQLSEWRTWLGTGRPFIRAKVALTLDGALALAPGQRSRITGRGGSRVTAYLRRQADAVMIGASTLEVDDPALTVRTDDGKLEERQPTRVIVSRTTIPDACASLFSDQGGRVLVLLSDSASLGDAGGLHAAGADVAAYPGSEGIAGALEALGADGVVSLLVEPGPGLFASLWDSELVDELVTVHAGGLGGSAAPSLYPFALERSTSELERTFRPVEAGLSGESAVTVWRRTSGPAK